MENDKVGRFLGHSVVLLHSPSPFITTNQSVKTHLHSAICR